MGVCQCPYARPAASGSHIMCFKKHSKSYSEMQVLTNKEGITKRECL